MKKYSRNHIWIWLLVLVILAGLGYYFYSKKGHDFEKGLVTKNPSPAQVKATTEKQPVITEKKVVKKPILAEKPSEEPLKTPPPKVDYCRVIEKNVAEFFQYLDEKQYIKQLDLQMDTYTRLKKIIKRLAGHLPVPAGEGQDPKIILQNIYYFFRILKQKDLNLIRQIVINEEDTLEVSMEMFYRWLMLGDRCPDPEHIRPSLQVLYKYAGFFLNTTGGRAYLFRRSAGVRLLVNYYSLLIVHKTDKNGKNTYGIDIFPYIAPLREGILNYPDFQYKNDYIEHLDQITIYYEEKR